MAVPVRTARTDVMARTIRISAKPPALQPYAYAEGEEQRLEVRPAHVEDAEGIHAILEYWVQQGTILRREIAEIENAIESFAVACDHETVVACAALVVYSSRLAEIRSVATNPERRLRGAGRAVIEYLTDWASRLEIERVFLLSKMPEFFVRCGYIEVDPLLLPDSFLLDYVHAQGRTAAGKCVMIREFAAEY